MLWLIVVAGVLFILYNLFFNSGGNAKYKSDLPQSKEHAKKKKGIIICFSILSGISLVLLIVAMISFL